MRNRTSCEILRMRQVGPGDFQIRKNMQTGERRVVIGDRPELGPVALDDPPLDAYPVAVRRRLAAS